jgi:hypothetical protein
MRRNVRFAAPLVLLLLAGCSAMSAHQRLEGTAMQSPGRWLPVQRSDFPSGDPARGTPTRAGSAALQDAAVSDAGIAAFVRAHGVPDAIAVRLVYQSDVTSCDLAYADQRTVYTLHPPAFDAASWDTQSAVTGQRALTDAEMDQVDPDRILAQQVEQLRAYVESLARVTTVGRKLLFAQPPPPAGTPTGDWYGVFWPQSGPLTARMFNHQEGANERVVVWVQPDGPGAGLLQLGDRVTAVDGKPPTPVGSADAPTMVGPKTLTIDRDGKTIDVRLQPEIWPRRLAFIALPDDAPNAFARDDEVAVTTGLLAAVPNDDALAWIIGHELAHISLGHTAPPSTGSAVANAVVGTVVTVGVLIPTEMVLPGGGRALGQVMQGVRNRFNREQERDADKLGVHYVRAAGYDPAAALTVLDTLQSKAPVGTVTQFLDIHPPYPERRKLVAAEIASLHSP